VKARNSGALRHAKISSIFKAPKLSTLDNLYN
jgi:hypothetical protein